MSAVFVLLLAACLGTSEVPHQEYVVSKGDTLFVIARAHGTTVGELRDWNGLEGDLIEIDQVLKIYPHDPAAGLPAGATRGRPGRRGSGRRGGGGGGGSGAAPWLSMPAAKPCLSGPTAADLTGDEGMVSSQGLSRGQIKAGMNAVLNHTLGCIPPTSGRVTVEVTVGCDGLVRSVGVDDRGPYDRQSIDCIVDVLEHAEFAAHDLPDGASFGYPLNFSF